MAKLMKAALSMVMTVMIASTALFSADAATAKESYQAANADQKDYYVNTYVPCYNAYLQAVRDLRNEIRNTNFETKEQAERVLNFLKDLRTRHVDFYGNRQTAGKSRYDVPAARTAMYQAADVANDYAAAMQYCQTLKTLVQARVGFLNGLRSDMQNFDLLGGSGGNATTTTQPITTTTIATTTTTTTTTTSVTAAPADAAVVIKADQVWDPYSFGFEMVITNRTDRDLSNWLLTFNIEGAVINSLWIDGGSIVLKNNPNKVMISPLNKYQNGYTIPANSSVVLRGTASGNAANVTVSDAHLHNASVPISYIR